MQLLKVKPQIKLVEEEVKTVEPNVQVKTVELEVGIEPLVAIQVETTKIIVEEIDVQMDMKYSDFIFCHFTRILGTKSKVQKG